MIDINHFADQAAKRQSPDPAAGDGLAKDSELALTFRGIVYPWHLDHMRHMNVQHYAGMFDQASWILLSLVGLDARYFREHRRGMAALEQKIQYKSELLAGDMFEIRSAIVEVGEKTIRLQHQMYKVGTGALAAATSILGIQIDTDARKAAPLPPGLRARAAALRESMASSGRSSEGRPRCVAR